MSDTKSIASLVNEVATAIDKGKDDDSWVGSRMAALIAFAAIEKAGHRIVPVEITKAMREAGEEAIGWGCHEDRPSAEVALGTWQAMLAAAPKVSP